MDNKKISIGTAQFGLKYGVTNKKKKLDLSEIKDILRLAKKHKINNIDTAYEYGDAEKKLGLVGVKEWNISSKFPFIPNKENIENWIQSKVKKSLSRLKVKKINTLFVHDSSQLESYKISKKIFACMNKLKNDGFIDKIGCSIYNPTILNKISKDFKIDTIQAPANLIDTRIFQKQHQLTLKNQKIKLEIRSIFLQGLLIENPKNIPLKFKKFKSFFSNLQNFNKKNEVSAISSATSFLYNKKFDKLIIGVTSSQQLMNFILNAKIKFLKTPKFKIDNKEYLINPYLW
jgi:aryl-alcohol dehydrogenase-like predicted oxidoreductase